MRASRILVGAALAVAALGLGAASAGASFQARSTSFKCNRTVNGGTINQNVQIPDNGVCIMNGVTVNGSVSANNNSYFESKGSKISNSVYGINSLTLYVWGHSSVGGNVAAYNTKQVFIYDSTVGHSVGAFRGAAPGYGHFQVCGTTIGQDLGVALMGPDVLIGDPAAGCGANTVQQGRIVIGYNATDQELYLIGNSVPNGDIEVFGNSGVGDKQVHGNNAPMGTLDCQDNASPFDGSANGTVGALGGNQCTATTITGNAGGGGGGDKAIVLPS